MALIDMLGFNGFTDRADLESQTPWELSGNFVFVTPNRLGVTGEKWCRVTSTGDIERRFGGIQSQQNEFEMSGVVHFLSEPASAGADIMSLYCTGSSNAPGVIIETAPDIVEGDNRQLAVALARASEPDGSGATTTVRQYPTGLRLTTGDTMYFVIRMRSESANGAGDGAFEVYINGVLVLSSTTMSWADWDLANTSPTSNYARFYGQSPGPTDWTSLIVRSNWSTADGVAPEFLYVEDVLALTVDSAGSYQTQAGSSTPADLAGALSDNDDATYVTSGTPDAVITLSGALPAGLPAGAVADDALLRTRVGKSGAGFNEARFALTNNGVEVAFEEQPVASVEPARQTITLRAGGIAVPAADLGIAYTTDVNGS